MDISPYYIDARNALTQPEKMIFVSQYFRRSWMPALGPLGTAIIIYLRGACYYNRKTGETRDTIQISQREIATGCGCSVPTIKRELERNEALRRFVKISPEWERDWASGRVRQLENHYQIAMDDPLTEVDEARLQEMVQERVAQEAQSVGRGGPPRKSIRLKEALAQTETSLTACSKAGFASVHDASRNEGSNAVNTASSNAAESREREEQLSLNKSDVVKKVSLGDKKPAPVAQIELLRPAARFESTPIQIELLYIESLPQTTSKNQEETLNVTETVNFVAREQEIRNRNEEKQPNKKQQATSRPPRTLKRNLLDDDLNNQAGRLVEELRDWGSERRHKQLLAICERHSLSHLCAQALRATRQRLTKEQKQGVLEKPGAYYQRILIHLLSEHQIFVPTAGEDDAEEVHRLARLSLGLEL